MREHTRQSPSLSTLYWTASSPPNCWNKTTPSPRLNHRTSNLVVIFAIKLNTGLLDRRNTILTLCNSHHSPSQRVFHSIQLRLAVRRVVLDDLNDKIRPSRVIVKETQLLYFYVLVNQLGLTLRAGNTIGTVGAAVYRTQTAVYLLTGLTERQQQEEESKSHRSRWEELCGTNKTG